MLQWMKVALTNDQVQGSNGNSKLTTYSPKPAFSPNMYQNMILPLSEPLHLVKMCSQPSNTPRSFRSEEARVQCAHMRQTCSFSGTLP
ncbi:hypothetical protein BAUCODRAFT_329528 [Baudoinia panamericana UAMH 10762]|uniref:Uncharacterized protein n=1 Tax=Baudoinia panamericana (strain UAMH 10762) TaxID=717646 RepID=M2MXT7_BAUPA|nr:uncharacterized protein BAUCODRAFT_329528 [Baudoinia panamericana UAMH 10762]EMC91469.1 hypothetical protein BAUCODRAFT_329528 [Baudoinia panamericana UAMH 10762]